MKSEDLRLNIIVNGDAGRKEILDTEKAISKLESELKSLKKAEGDHSKEISETNKKLTDAKSKYAELQRQISLDGKTMAELKTHVTATRAALSKAVPGTDNWVALNNELLVSSKRLKALENQAKNTKEVVSEVWHSWSGVAVAANNISNLISRYSGQIEEAKQSWLQYDEALVDAMKTTGLSRDEIEELSAELKKFDTRTAQNELLSLARVGGKLGISGKEDLLEFVSAADKINVALKEDLGGDAEAAIGQIGKLVDIFQLKGQMGLEKAMLSVGSAINELGAASTANEGYIVNFTNRLAGIAPNAKISIDKILGLASTLDANAQAAETAATAIGQTITAMFRKTETFAQIAKMPFEEFRDLLTNDVNGALVKVLEGMKGDQGLFNIVDAMDEMHLNGQRATTVLGALANNVDMLKTQQQLANEAFQEGTSLTNEFNTKNESATAIQEKLKKRITETSVEIGQKLMPAANMVIGGTNTFLGVISKLITLFGKYQAAIITVTGLTALYVAKKKIAYLFSAEFRAALLKEVAVLEASSKANSLHTVTLKILAGGYKTAGAAAKAFGKALIANPVGLVIAAVAALAHGIAFLVSKSREATKELRELNKRTVDTTSSFVKAQAEIDKERKSLEELKDAATKAAEGSDERKRVIDKINELYGDYLPQLLTEKTSNEELETALKNVNTQLEQKIKLQARENAEMDIQQHKMDAVKAALDSFNKRYEKMNKGQSLSAAQVGSLTGALSQYYDMPDISHFIEMRDVIAGIFNETIDNQDRQVNNIIALFTEAQENGAKLRSMVDGLFGVQSSGKNAPLGTLTDGSTEDSGGGTGGKGSSGSSPVETAAEKSALALQKGLEQVFQEVNEESEKLFQETLKRIEQDAEMKTQLVIDNEKDLTQKAIMEEDLRYEKERAKAGDNAELLELAETKHQNNLDKIRLDAFNREVKRLEDEHKLRRTQMENSQAAELLAFKGTEEEKAALKRKHTAELANFDVEYLQNLEAMLQKVADAKTLEGMSVSLDDANYNKIMQQLADIIKRKNAAVGTAQESSQEPSDSPKKESHSLTEGTGNGSLFGVSQDDWETFFANLKEGKFGAEDLQTVVAGIGGAAQEAFSLASKFMDLTKKKEDAQLKDYKKNQDNRKKSLEKRLNAGLITESQYNAQVEQMDAEYDAYQEELALKQAKRDKALNLTQAIINTALSVTSTIAQLGATPWGIAAAAIAAAMGAAEIAIIASQPVTSGAEEGGYIGVKRRQDGKSFNARLNPDARGFVSSPTVIVGENGSEYVIPHEALENPTLLPIISTMETARRNGKLRSLNFNAVYPATAMPGRVSGGFIDEGNSRIVTTSSDGHEDTATDAALTKAIEKLTKKLDEPITARVSMLGKGGIKETEDKYNKLKRRGQLG
jgi:TP901 family phage tail tape measure protein